MINKFVEFYYRILPDLRLILADMGFSLLSMMTVEKIFMDIFHTIIAVIGTIIGGSTLFLLQKVILPRISSWCNKKIDKWFDITQD